MVTHVVSLLNAARHATFVGRTDELRLFNSLLDRVCLPLCGLYVYGPGGLGKTALLHEFARVGRAAGATVAYLDGRDIQATPEALLAAVGSRLGLPAGESPLPVLAAATRRTVVLIDAYETLRPLDAWLREAFLPALSRNVLVVLAGRDVPSVAWRGDSGWQLLIHPLALRNLGPDESRTYLLQRGVPADQHAAILAFTHGHPLALALVADACAGRPDWQFRPDASPDLIAALLERLVDRVPDDAHRTALEASALVRGMTEGLLAAAIESADGHELFEWLRSLPYMEYAADGLRPHDLVREALLTDLRWRNPDRYAELYRRARTYYTRRLKETNGHTQRTVLDVIFLHRDNPVVRPYFDWRMEGGLRSEAARPADTEALVSLVRHHEGAAAARLASHWLAHPAAHTIVIRDGTPQPAGLMMAIALHALHALAPADADADPAVKAALRHLDGRVRLDAGERATLFRFWMVCDEYQAVSPVQTVLFASAVQQHLATPQLACTLVPCAEPEFWAPLFAYADLERVVSADFTVDGRRYGVYAHDRRVRPPADWLSLLAERELLTEAPTDMVPTASEDLLVLSRPDFAAAVRQSLHDLAEPALLRGNPLLRSRVVTQQCGLRRDETERIEVLRGLLRAAIDGLQGTPRAVKLHRALFHTYVQPAPTQEQAAELLGVPFSTFRRHLAAGIEQVTAALWALELGHSADAAPLPASDFARAGQPM
jgi:hypothetical protein